ncbi:MAG: glycosyltransferase family 39 protein [Nostoc sp.]|uniref:ArnT family glycosyltransferase n=1 Tax=Nostoc sp. TaxID=1180 RepID=UPI002FFA1BF7
MNINAFNTKNHLLIAILIVGAILRLNHINQPFTDYISWRQTSTAMMADNFYNRNWNIFYPEISWNGPEPSYNGREFQTVTYIAALLYVLVGQHDWVGRGVAIIFGLWGIFALYQLIRRVWDEQHAIISAAVMALLPGSIFVDRSFLPDPAMVSLTVTSFWMLVVYLQTDRRRYLLLASAIASWGWLTKIPGLIVGIPMLYAMVTILASRKKLYPKKLLEIGLAAGFALIPVVAYYLWARYLSLTYPPYHFAGGGNWLWDHGLQEGLRQKYFLPALYWNYNRWIWTKPVIALVFIGLLLRPPQRHQYSWSAQNLDDDFPKAPWLFHWWMFAGVIYYLIGAKELVVNSWNFHIVNPAAAAIAGHTIFAIASLINRITRSHAAIVFIVAIFLIVGGVGQRNLRNMYNPLEPRWDATQSYKLGLALHQISTAQDLVVTIPNDIGEPVAIYYSKRRGWVFPPAWPGVVWWSEIVIKDNEAIGLFQKLRAKGADWFGIVNEHKNELWEKNPKFIEYLERTCKLEQETSEFLIYRILSPEKI